MALCSRSSINIPHGMMRGVGVERDLLSQAQALVVQAAADPAAVLRAVERILEDARSEADDAAQAVALRARGLGQAAMYDVAAAIESLESARAVAARTADTALSGEIEMTYAGVLAWAGRNAEASDAIESALEALEGRDQARALVQRGTMRYRLGDLRGSLEDLDAAAAPLVEAEDIDWLARLHNNRGLVLGFLGSHAEAEADLLLSLDYHGRIGQDNGSAEALQNLGWVASIRGDVPAALAYFDEAEDLFRRLDYPLAELLGDRCDALVSVHLVSEAVDLATAAVAELATADHPTALAEALLRLAAAARLAGRHGQALDAARQARELLRAQHRDSWAAFADFLALQARIGLDEAGDVSAGDIVSVADELQAAGFEQQALHARLLAGKVAVAGGEIEGGRRQLALAARARESGPADLRVQAWLAQALLCAAEGDATGIDRAARAGLGVVDSYQAMLGASDARAAVAGHAAELGAMGLAVAAASRDTRRLFGWMERTRAGSLRFAPVTPPDDAALAAELAAMREVESRLRDAETAAEELSGLQRRRVDIQERIRRRSLRKAGIGVSAPRPPSAGDVLEALGDRVLVEMSRVGDALLSVTLRNGRVARRQLGLPAEALRELDALRFAVRRIMTGAASEASIEAARSVIGAAAARLDDMLMAPLRLDAEQVVIVPPADLHALPWRLLPSLGGVAVVVVPSAALWMARAGRAAAGPVVLAAGPSLAESDAEVTMLGNVYPGATALDSAIATVDRVLSSMDGASLVHVACHGRVRADNPLFSSLEMADGSLTVYDIERLGTAPATMVLSACDAGLPAERPGNEIMGLVAALLGAGTRTVVASTGLVPDTVSTLDLMESLHRRMARGDDVAAALLAAQSAYDPLSTEGLAAASFVCFGRS
jgi:tetratricopeptide (TPR) repeat protein